MINLVKFEKMIHKIVIILNIIIIFHLHARVTNLEIKMKAYEQDQYIDLEKSDYRKILHESINNKKGKNGK